MIDAHHHIWRQQDLPWLLGAEKPRIFGSYAAIKRDYLIAEYREDIAASGIEKSVYVQANWANNWAEDEAAWVQSVADETGWPHAIVAFADFTVPDVRPQLDKLKNYSLLRGIRQQLHWHENPQYTFASKPDIAADKTFQKNIAYLAEYNWCFDLQVFSSQVQSAVSLANACPDVQFILQHAGMLEDTSSQGWDQWGNAQSLLAACDNVHAKLSGLGTFVHRVDVDLMCKIVTQTVSQFGAHRCLFGSNFPIEKIWTSYSSLVNAMIVATAQLDETSQEAIFRKTAERLYRL